MCFGGSWLRDTQAHCKGVVCFPFPHLPGAGPPPPRGHLRRTHDRLLQEGPAAAELASPGPIVHLRANDVEKQQVHGHSRAGLSSSACCRHIPDMLRLPRLPQLPGRITFLAPRLTHSAAPRKPTGLCQALYMHHDTASSGPTTFMADRRRRHPERLSHSPSVAQLWDATLRREMGMPACRMWAEAFGNHSLPTWLSELLSRYSFDSGFYRGDKKFVERSDAILVERAGKEFKAAGGGVAFLPPMAGNIRCLQHHRKVSFLNVFAWVT